jgi:hypothetical protein
MRNVFNALAKIIGLWNVSLGVLNLAGMVTTMTMAGGAVGFLICIYVAAACVRFLVAWVLIFKTDWLADKLKVPRDEDPFKPLEKSALFTIGVQLLGLYFFFVAICDLTRAFGEVYSITAWGGMPFSRDFFAHGLRGVVTMFLSVICMLKADGIVRIIASKEQVKWSKVVAITLLVAAVLSILGVALQGIVQQDALQKEAARWHERRETQLDADDPEEAFPGESATPVTAPVNVLLH